MSLDALGTEDKARLKETIEKCARMKLDIKDQNDGIKDLVANVAEETGVDKKIINDAIKYEFKEMSSDNGNGSLEAAKEALSDTEELLHVIGKA